MPLDKAHRNNIHWDWIAAMDGVGVSLLWPFKHNKYLKLYLKKNLELWFKHFNKKCQIFYKRKGQKVKEQKDRFTKFNLFSSLLFQIDTFSKKLSCFWWISSQNLSICTGFVIFRSSQFFRSPISIQANLFGPKLGSLQWKKKIQINIWTV